MFRLPIGEGGWPELQRLAADQRLTLIAAEPPANGATAGLGGDAATGSDAHAAGTSGAAWRASGAHAGASSSAGSASQGSGDSGGSGSSGHGAAASGSSSSSGNGGVCLVLGSEGQGLSDHALSVCTAVGIPMAGQMESLNVGIAGGILMFALSDGSGTLAQQLQCYAPAVAK